MAAQLILPTGIKRYPLPRNEREELLNRLYELRVLLPDAENMEVQQLRDYVQWQEYRAAERARQAAQEIARTPRYSREEIVGALKEYFAWRRRRQEQGPRVMVVRP